LIQHDGLVAIEPGFKDDADVVPVPLREPTFSNCEKIVERDVEIYRKETQAVCMHFGVRSANVVSYNVPFSASVKEQQAIHVMSDHLAT
jgi:hypothetical protein